MPGRELKVRDNAPVDSEGYVILPFPQSTGFFQTGTFFRDMGSSPAFMHYDDSTEADAVQGPVMGADAELIRIIVRHKEPQDSGFSFKLTLLQGLENPGPYSWDFLADDFVERIGIVEVEPGLIIPKGELTGFQYEATAGTGISFLHVWMLCRYTPTAT